jgi:hypothetical protein
VLAAGALERHVAFPMNDRPGILLASAVRAYLHRWGVVPGRRIAVFTTCDDGHRTAADLRAAGIEVPAVIDPREDAPGEDTIRGEVTQTTGRLGLRRIEIRTNGGIRRVECDALAVSGGWNPTLHLTCHLGARPAWDERLATFLPTPDAVPGMEVAGAAAGLFSTAQALESGRDRARAALSHRGVGGREPFRREAFTRGIRAHGPDGDGREGRAEGRRAGLGDAAPGRVGQHGEGRDVRGLALVGRHALRRVSLHVLGRGEGLGCGLTDVLHGHIVLEIQPGA